MHIRKLLLSLLVFGSLVITSCNNGSSESSSSSVSPEPTTSSSSSSSESSSSSQPTVKSMYIDAEKNSIEVGDELQLTIRDSESHNPILSTTVWTSDNSEIASITTSTGLVTGVSKGTATITAATTGYTSATFILTVTEAPVVTTEYYSVYTHGEIDPVVTKMTKGTAALEPTCEEWTTVDMEFSVGDKFTIRDDKQNTPSFSLGEEYSQFTISNHTLTCTEAGTYKFYYQPSYEKLYIEDSSDVQFAIHMNPNRLTDNNCGYVYWWNSKSLTGWAEMTNIGGNFYTVDVKKNTVGFLIYNVNEPGDPTSSPKITPTDVTFSTEYNTYNVEAPVGWTDTTALVTCGYSLDSGTTMHVVPPSKYVEKDTKYYTEYVIDHTYESNGTLDVNYKNGDTWTKITNLSVETGSSSKVSWNETTKQLDVEAGQFTIYVKVRIGDLGPEALVYATEIIPAVDVTFAIHMNPNRLTDENCGYVYYWGGSEEAGWTPLTNIGTQFYTATVKNDIAGFLIYDVNEPGDPSTSTKITPTDVTFSTEYNTYNVENPVGWTDTTALVTCGYSLDSGASTTPVAPSKYVEKDTKYYTEYVIDHTYESEGTLDINYFDDVWTKITDVTVETGSSSKVSWNGTSQQLDVEAGQFTIYVKVRIGDLGPEALVYATEIIPVVDVTFAIHMNPNRLTDENCGYVYYWGGSEEAGWTPLTNIGTQFYTATVKSDITGFLIYDVNEPGDPTSSPKITVDDVAFSTTYNTYNVEDPVGWTDTTALVTCGYSLDSGATTTVVAPSKYVQKDTEYYTEYVIDHTYESDGTLDVNYKNGDTWTKITNLSVESGSSSKVSWNETTKQLDVEAGQFTIYVKVRIGDLGPEALVYATEIIPVVDVTFAIHMNPNRLTDENCGYVYYWGGSEEAGWTPLTNIGTQFYTATVKSDITGFLIYDVNEPGDPTSSPKITVDDVAFSTTYNTYNVEDPVGWTDTTALVTCGYSLDSGATTTVVAPSKYVQKDTEYYTEYVIDHTYESDGTLDVNYKNGDTWIKITNLSVESGSSSKVSWNETTKQLDVEVGQFTIYVKVRIGDLGPEALVYAIEITYQYTFEEYQNGTRYSTIMTSRDDGWYYAAWDLTSTYEDYIQIRKDTLYNGVVQEDLKVYLSNCKVEETHTTGWVVYNPADPTATWVEPANVWATYNNIKYVKPITE